MAAKPWSAPGYLPRCDKCDKEFEKLLACSRCKQAFYCSRECQNAAWKHHKNICKRPGKPGDELKKDAEEPKPVPTKAAEPSPKKQLAQDQPQTAEAEEDEDAVEAAKQFRQELLRETQVANAKMVQAMQDSRGDASIFLPQVLELKEEYQRRLLDHLSAQKRAQRLAAEKRANSAKACGGVEEEENESMTAAKLGQDLMKEVIMAILQRGLSPSACVDQIDLANNHFNAGVLWPRNPKDFGLEEGDLDGFEPAVLKVKEKGFVCIEGLLDDEISTVVFNECKEKYYERRDIGAMHLARGSVTGGYECWLPYPSRRGTTPELDHALRVLFGLPYEFQRQNYPVQLKVPTMAQLMCFLPGEGQEKLHLDNATRSNAGGRELTFVLFCTPGLTEEHGGAVRAYLDSDDRPGPRPEGPSTKIVNSSDVESINQSALSTSELDGTVEACGAGTVAQGSPAEDVPHSKDFYPETGRCLIFRSRELWHEVLPANRMQFVLTLFVQRAD